jgi:hypothetical protein
MIGEISRRLHASPFSPFVILTSNGRRYSIPHPDHIHIGPRGTRVFIFHDDDTSAALTPLHIVAVKDGRPRARSPRDNDLRKFAATGVTE